MNTPTATSILPTKITLSWTPITSDDDTGRDPIIYYRVNFLSRPCYYSTTECDQEDISLGSWVERTSATVQYANTTFVDTFSTVLKANEIFYYQICPMNKVGYGACSDNFTFLSCNTPQYMNMPAVTAANTNPKWIYVTWSPITSPYDTGRSPITFYDLQCDMGTNQTTWTSLISTSAGVVLAFNHTSTVPY